MQYFNCIVYLLKYIMDELLNNLGFVEKKPQHQVKISRNSLITHIGNKR